MKQIKAYIRPALVDHVIDMIEDQSADSPGVAASEVRVFGHPEDTDPLERTHLAKLEIVVRDEDAQGVIDIILEHAQTGRSGDGAIYVTEVTEAIRIRNGKRDREAVHSVVEEPGSG
ncbi:nitrogen regulatory protein P-II 1 [Salinibacter ruber]|jgi:nitrogen regulatory protein P-II 1|uniref:P-II family nitrogen regulator n=1 Tax=Salinibacter ruber TaxID=146919 RepID=UPI00216702E1|nr:P-II family nitrogen regulator [Salinibacter ruber]MCS3937258.1 nitrogen regulatory protein P-II 1 [Salinibacter ruber]MCS4047619.1 nitrogen regulatory protein P-II 1 [Salinibacter ruber]